MGTIKACAREILRWAAIALCGGYGVWNLFQMGAGIVRRWNGDWFGTILALAFLLLFVSPFLAVAVICWRRRYHQLFLVIGVIGTLAIFGLLNALPEWFGMFEFFRSMESDSPLASIGFPVGFVEVPLVLLSVFAPIYAAAWFFRFCHDLAQRTAPGGNAAPRPRTRATFWLVWLGVILMFVPTTVGMLLTFRLLTQSSAGEIPQQPLQDLLRWSIGLSATGILLLFLGLVRRRPIPEP
jgi:hypothetical protein